MGRTRSRSQGEGLGGRQRGWGSRAFTRGSEPDLNPCHRTAKPHVNEEETKTKKEEALVQGHTERRGPFKVF